MRELVLSNRAEADLREIWVYSFKNWGEGQADRYLDQLDDGLQKCGAEPERGKDRSAVRPGYWSKLVRRHLSSTPSPMMIYAKPTRAQLRHLYCDQNGPVTFEVGRPAGPDSTRLLHAGISSED